MLKLYVCHSCQTHCARMKRMRLRMIVPMLIAMGLPTVVKGITEEKFFRNHEGRATVTTENIRQRVACAFKCSRDSGCSGFLLDRNRQCKLIFTVEPQTVPPQNDTDNCRYETRNSGNNSDGNILTKRMPTVEPPVSLFCFSFTFTRPCFRTVSSCS